MAGRKPVFFVAAMIAAFFTDPWSLTGLVVLGVLIVVAVCVQIADRRALTPEP